MHFTLICKICQGLRGSNICDPESSPELDAQFRGTFSIYWYGRHFYVLSVNLLRKQRRKIVIQHLLRFATVALLITRKILLCEATQAFPLLIPYLVRM